MLSFEAVLQLAAQDKTGAGEPEKLAATLGKALCLADEGKPDDGIKLVEEVINALPADEPALLAQAYVTLGECYLKKPDQQIAGAARLSARRRSLSDADQSREAGASSTWPCSGHKPTRRIGPKMPRTAPPNSWPAARTAAAE